MTTPKRASGFTLIELNLAIIFVAMLLLAVIATTMYASRLYSQGVTLKSINQVGREVTDQMRRDISGTSPSKIQVKTLNVAGTDVATRVCLGAVSYVINPAQYLRDGDPSLVRDAVNEPISLVRIENDQNSEWCAEGGSGFTRMFVTGSDSYRELLPQDVIPLAVHSASVSQLAVAATGSSGLTRFMVQLGTNETETIDGGVCRPPTALENNFDNCAVREFQTIIRMTGRST